MKNRWYTSNLHKVIIYIKKAFILPWHEGLHPSTKETGVKCLQPGSDSLLHIGICCKSLDSQRLLKGTKEMEMAGCKIRTAVRVVCNLPDITL